MRLPTASRSFGIGFQGEVDDHRVVVGADIRAQEAIMDTNLGGDEDMVNRGNIEKLPENQFPRRESGLKPITLAAI